MDTFNVQINCENHIPVLVIDALTDTETITKVSVFSQATWKTNTPVLEENVSTYHFEGSYHSEDLDGACLNRDLIIVKITAVPQEEGFETSYYTAMAYNKRIEIKKTLSYCNELCDCCKFPDGLLNSLLQVNVLDYAIQANDVNRAVGYWDKWYKGEYSCNSSNNTGGCGCA